MFKRILLGVIAVLLLWTLYEWITFPNVSKLATEAPQTTSFMEIRRKELRSEGKDDQILYTFVPYGRISPYLRRGVLVAEDNEFYEHNGIDVEGMKAALRKDWQNKELSQGGSTITQQLAKNLYLSPSRNPLRKLKEYLITRSLEKHLTKKRILELYLNVVEMGERVYGAEAASQFYFHKSASALTSSQAALLAGCLPNPREMVPSSPNKRLRARQAMILSRMKRWGYVAEEIVLTAPKPKQEATPSAPPQTDTDLTAPDTEKSPPTTTTSEPAKSETTSTSTTTTTTTAATPTTSSPSTTSTQ